MTNWHGNGEKPKMGAKIQYALSKNKVATATYGITANWMTQGGDNKFGLSDGTPWKFVLMWKYVDEDYEYGDSVQNV